MIASLYDPETGLYSATFGKPVKVIGGDRIEVDLDSDHENAPGLLIERQNDKWHIVITTNRLGDASCMVEIPDARNAPVTVKPCFKDRGPDAEYTIPE
jgi:hypothetical protein